MATVNDLLHVAKKDLRVLNANGTVSEALKLLNTAQNRMIVVKSEDQKITGIVTKTDILQGINTQGAKPETQCHTLMHANIYSCQATDNLNEVWAVMSENNLNAMPVIDENQIPIGILSAKCVLVKLLSKCRQQDQLMHDYIQGMGYQ